MYRLEDVEIVGTDQGRHGYRSESGYRSETGYRSDLYIIYTVSKSNLINLFSKVVFKILCEEKIYTLSSIKYHSCLKKKIIVNIETL